MSKLSTLKTKALNEALNCLREGNLYDIKRDLVNKMTELGIDNILAIKIAGCINDSICKQEKYINESKNWIGAVLQDEM